MNMLPFTLCLIVPFFLFLWGVVLTVAHFLDNPPPPPPPKN